MPARTSRRPLRILRYDTTDNGGVPLAGGGLIDSFGAPCFGWQVLTIYLRVALASQIEVYQRLRANSAWALTDQWIFLGATTQRVVVRLTGEHVRVLFTNGVGPQTPELVCTLDT